MSLFPSVGEYQGVEVGVDGWEREHPRRRRERGYGGGKPGKGISF